MKSFNGCKKTEMPIKINELVIQVKVHDDPKQMDLLTHTLMDVFPTTEQQRLLLAKDLLDLLEIQEAR